jgi:Thiamine pyrophosphate enzyme, C-terminal TPP binding domain
MGLASSVALGVALGRPAERVLAICGDGSLAMNFSSLVTIRHAAPANLCLLVIANNTYEYTASLPSPSSSLDWVSVGGSIFGEARCLPLAQAGADLLSGASGPMMLVANVERSSQAAPGLGLSPVEIRDTFRRAASAR